MREGGKGHARTAQETAACPRGGAPPPGTQLHAPAACVRAHAPAAPSAAPPPRQRRWWGRRGARCPARGPLPRTACATRAPPGAPCPAARGAGRGQLLSVKPSSVLVSAQLRTANASERRCNGGCMPRASTEAAHITAHTAACCAAAVTRHAPSPPHLRQHQLDQRGCGVHQVGHALAVLALHSGGQRLLGGGGRSAQGSDAVKGQCACPAT